MLSQTLREARIYEEVAAKKIRGAQRPSYHLCARTGWMNDPNGFSFYEGQYHLFYQYHPYSTSWGPMHWGHAVSRDLLHWEYLPVVMAPDELYDGSGCYSGSAVTLPDGRQLLMYTGVRHEQVAPGILSEIQTQCLAVGDGYNYEKYERNPVLTAADLPDGASHQDFRDPKIVQRPDGTYDSYIANRPADGSGQILLYHSEDGFHWSFVKVLIENKGRLGKMWECPDFFALDGRQVLLTSPQDMLPADFEYHNGNGNLCLIGSWDEEKQEFSEEADQAIDYGIDFYAPQTVLTPDGRRVMIGWMQNWDTVTQHRNSNLPWYGQMTLPRELSIKNGRLWQWPVRELEQCRSARAEHHETAFTGSRTWDDVSGRKVDLEIRLRPSEEARPYQKFSVRLAKNDRFFTTLSFHPGENILKIDRKFSGSRRAIIHQRRARVNSDGGCLDLRIILDLYSMEVFVNGGESVMTATIFTDTEAADIEFLADGFIDLDVVKYDLC